jgi:hypothetical protein
MPLLTLASLSWRDKYTVWVKKKEKSSNGLFFALTITQNGLFVVHHMSATMSLPITVSDLSPRTRDWLLAKSSRLGISPLVALNEVLDQIAIEELGENRPTAAEETNKEEQP